MRGQRKRVPERAAGATLLGSGSGSLYVLGQASGAIVWTQLLQGGADSDPAVTADGVYVTYPRQTYDFRPATGDSIWSNR